MIGAETHHRREGSRLGWGPTAPVACPPVPDGGLLLLLQPLVGSAEAMWSCLPGRLSLDERARLDRLASPEAKHEFIAGRLLLRWALGDLLGVPPEDLKIAIEPNGKPYVPSAPGLSFNLAHCRGWVVVAVTREARVGVDIENLDYVNPDIGTAIDRYVDPVERAWIEQAAIIDRLARGIELWTLKEAYVKAIGTGLRRPLNSYRFSITGAGCLRFQDLDVSQPAAAEMWQFGTWRPQPSLRLSVAVEGRRLSYPPSAWTVDPTGTVQQADLPTLLFSDPRTTDLPQPADPGAVVRGQQYGESP